MIYITGDCHANFRRFTKKHRGNLQEGDYVIVCGDFGLCWADDAEFRYNCDWLSRVPFTILFSEGNHENFDMLNSYPVETWHGGKVHHIIRDKVIHLMRGQIFEIEGKTFFTFGGASSHDIQGGILDRKSPDYQELRRKAIKRDLPYRVIGETWWKEELPTEEEMQEGRDNLAKVNYQVDYVITHCMANRKQYALSLCKGVRYNSQKYTSDILTDYFDELEDKLQYKRWFNGHYHVECHLDEKHTIIYHNVLPLADYYEDFEEE